MNENKQMNFIECFYHLGKNPSNDYAKNTVLYVPSIGIRVKRQIKGYEWLVFVSIYSQEIIENKALILNGEYDVYAKTEFGKVVIESSHVNNNKKYSIEEFRKMIDSSKKEINLFNELYDLLSDMNDYDLLDVLKAYLNKTSSIKVYDMKDFDKCFCKELPSEIIKKLSINFDYDDDVFYINNQGLIESCIDIRNYMEQRNLGYEEIIDYIIEKHDDLGCLLVCEILKGKKE